MWPQFLSAVPDVVEWDRENRREDMPLCRKPADEENQSKHLAFKGIVEAVTYTKVYPNGEKYIGDLDGEKRHGQRRVFKHLAWVI